MTAFFSTYPPGAGANSRNSLPFARVSAILMNPREERMEQVERMQKATKRPECQDEKP